MATRVIIAQFAKFKRIDFTKFGSDEQIEFYKKESKFSFVSLFHIFFGHN